MPLQSLLNEIDSKILLFSYENINRTTENISPESINDDLRTFVVTKGEYILWELNKRKLQKEEILLRSWMFTSKENVSFIVNFTSDDQIMVSSVFGEEHHYGQWFLENGILKIIFDYKTLSYDITVIANNSESIHSALQIRGDKCTELLKIAPLRHAIEGSSLSL